MDRIAYCAIHPAIGVARVGDSPDEFFLGPEGPYGSGPPSSYKDAAGRVKRQAVRFRVFGFDAEDQPVRELTAAEAEITWTVHLVNRKGAAVPFGDGTGRRNAGSDESDLIIDPGSRTVTGRGAAEVLDGGRFLGRDVPLGEVRTDEDGRLLVLGGHGTSGSVPPDAPIEHFADNDGWHDDTSDGPVTASVVVDGQTFNARPAWAVVAPPDFAPEISNLVTLYDVLEDVAWQKDGRKPLDTVSFQAEILPLLVRAQGYQWVSGVATRGHRRAVDQRGAVDRTGDFLEPDHLALLADPGPRGRRSRRQVFGLIRTPYQDADPQTAANQASPRFMPQLSGDLGPARPQQAGTWFTVTPLQYERLRRWAAGEFTDAAPPESPARPADLDRAALEACVGGPFYPGIEISSRCRDASEYDRPFRLHGRQHPGYMTERMAVPWQADFTDCRHLWWPAQRPDDVIVEQDYRAVTSALFPGGDLPDRPIDTTAFPRWRWDRGIGDQLPASPVRGINDERHREMVGEWSKLGFVTPAKDGSGVHLETERQPYVGLRHRDYFHLMLNLHRYPDFLPTAWKLANDFIAAAAAKQEDPYLDTELRWFEYEERAFDARMDSIYNDLVDAAAAYSPDADPIVHSRADAIERLRQSAPLNQTDGVWLRNVATIGPIDDLTGFLSEIWQDEVGNGDPAHNHANIFTKTLESVGIQTAPIASTEYAQDYRLLESAFTVPLLQLVISQFTDQFLPEILGMTLYLEWESVALSMNARLLKHYDIDATYYTMHVAIDNADAGHGAIAKRAVKRYLARFPSEAARNEEWRRVWNGYVAFRTTGSWGADLSALLTSSSRARDRVVAMIEQKKRYGSLNHARVAQSTRMTNNLFDYPYDLLDALVASGQVAPGDPDASPFIQQMHFGGRMYRVFTAEEELDWSAWIRSLSPSAPSSSSSSSSSPSPSSPSSAEAAMPAPVPSFSAGPKPTSDPPRPPVPTGRVRHLLLTSPAEEIANHPRGAIEGTGTVH